MLTLVSDLATDYFTLLELDRELAISEESERVYKGTFDLFSLRYQAGKDNRLPVERAKADYDQSLAAIAVLKRRITQQENAICVLLGAYPRPIERGRLLEQQTTPPTPVGATSNLLERRPDILQAEQVMKGANEEIGVAVANYFPTIDLSALAGEFGVTLNTVDRGFGVWNTALQATGPIFTGNRLGAEYRGRRAFWDETIAQYRRTVINAFRETSDALIAEQMLVHQRAGLEDRVRALRQAVDLALGRYYAGRASYFEVLEAQQQLFPAQDLLAQTERDQLLAVVNLYKALGGGWNLTDAQWSPHLR
jgi:multidrug efflux system outer membrane protein